MTIGSETIPEYSFGGVHAETHSQAIGPDHSGIQRLFSDFFQFRIPHSHYFHAQDNQGSTKPHPLISMLSHCIVWRVVISGFWSSGSNMQGEAAVEEVKAEPGDQQGVDAQIRSREPLQVSVLAVLVLVAVVKVIVVVSCLQNPSCHESLGCKCCSS